MKHIIIFLSENFQFLEVTFSIYLNTYVFVMNVRLEVKFGIVHVACTNLQQRP